MRAVLFFAVLVLGCGDPDTLTPLEAGAGADDLAVRDLSLVFEEPDLTRPILCQRDVDCPGTELCLDGFCVERPDLATGCVDDNECKGGRVCRGGQCVDPPANEDLGELVQDLVAPRDLVCVVPDLFTLRRECEDGHYAYRTCSDGGGSRCVYFPGGNVYDGKTCAPGDPKCSGCNCAPGTIVWGTPDQMGLCPRLPYPDGGC